MSQVTCFIFMCMWNTKKGTIVNVITKGVMYKMNTRSQDIYINNDNLNYSAKQFQALIGGVLGPVFVRCCGKVFF